MVEQGAVEQDVINSDNAAAKKQVLAQMVRETSGLWRGSSYEQRRYQPNRHTVDSGFEQLNALLPVGGWPLKSIVEINVETWGNGELQLLLPLIARLTGNDSKVAMVAPPYQPYAPALLQSGVSLSNLLVIEVPDADGPILGSGRRSGSRQGSKNKAVKSRGGDIWWSAEKLLRHAECGLVLIWPERPDPVQVRRLQVAADEAGGIGVIFRCGKPVDTPVGMRLKVSRCSEGVQVQLLKSRFGWRQHGVALLPSVYSG